MAATSVFYFHSYIALSYFNPGALYTWDWLAYRRASGVDLFFAISGFIVCYITAKPDFSPATFLAKRFFRIYPANAIATLALVAIVAAGVKWLDRRKEAPEPFQTIASGTTQA
ncbi:acyltransferase family protein [Bradyrhizobium sp. PMVTL-01]|uniref:acyltransferase family protein n=1 Tax=Bradyrhizobium sp. PMVTL-01 TaxID=3434999 RepID=UPI003F707686